jgi:hypothetical protein
MSKLFLSCVSRELGAYRTLLTADLRRAKVDVRVQEDFGVGGGTLLDALDAYIRECNAVIHLIGHGTGAFPEVPAVRALLVRYPDIAEKIPALRNILSQPDPRISYTQWEAYLAIYHDREIHIYLPSQTAPRGASFIATPEEVSSQKEHLERIEALGWHRGSFENEERLSTYVLGDLRHILRSDDKPFLAAPSKLPKKHDTGVFEGREKVLADLDALWADVLARKDRRAQIVSLVAIGGAGKTTVASRWKDALLARDDHGGVERYFDWSFYSQGTRREGDNASAQTAADSTVFIAAALKFFGDPVMADGAAHPWDKGARLAALVAQHRTLLILDGLEPLQHPPGPQQGELKDDALRALLAGLQSAGRGLCVLTTREPIADLVSTRETVTPQWRLDHLTDVAGALVLRGHGVTGPDIELRSASAEVKGHALTLSLMGRYLTLAFDPPDIARRDCFRFSEADAETQNGHAFRVFAAYEAWFESEDRHVEVAILRLLGLFDRPATPDCLAALSAAPAIPRLTEPLVGLGEKQWNIAIQRLAELDLIETVEWLPLPVSGYGEEEAQAGLKAGWQGKTLDIGPPQPFASPASLIVLHSSIDAHPLVREYFDAQLKEQGSAPLAHARLWEHLCASVPFWPEGRDGLLPLYQAVAHGCKAGHFEEVCERVYYHRIQRGVAAYSTKKLGLLGLDLAAQACFFTEPWRRLAAELAPTTQGWLLNEAAYSLRALNRLTEAREPIRVALKLAVKMENWQSAASRASTLSQIELNLGDVPAAESTAAQSVTFADRSNDAYHRSSKRAGHANALLEAGHLEASHTLFLAAETIQAERHPSFPMLVGLQGYLYCDVLLAVNEPTAWQRSMAMRPSTSASLLSDLDIIMHRAKRMFVSRTSDDSLLRIALDNLAVGRVHLLRSVQVSPLDTASHDLIEAREFLGNALATLRSASRSDDLPRALLPDAWFHTLAGEWSIARQRLDESFALATRGANEENGWLGGMRLHLIDTLLHRARLFGRLKNESARMPGVSRPPDDYPWPGRAAQMDLDEASALITVCGYHRRDQELADAKAALA